MLILLHRQANKDTLNYAAANGFFDQGLMNHALEMKDEESDDEPKAKKLDIRMHYFEYTAQLKEDESFEKRFPPLQVIFALKVSRYDEFTVFHRI